jgi:hypothetical protein
MSFQKKKKIAFLALKIHVPHEDQWKRIEDPDMNPHSYDPLFSTKVTKHTMEKRQPLQQMLLGKVVNHLKEN